MAAEAGDSPPEPEAGTTPPETPEPALEALERFVAETGAKETGHLQGLLTDLAEWRDPIGAVVPSGAHRNGHVEVIGADFIGLRLDDGGLSLLALTSIAFLRLGPDTDVVGDRPTPIRDTDLHSVLERLLSDQLEVTIVVTGSTTAQTGTFERLGQDLMMLRSDDNSMVHVPLPALIEVRISPGPWRLRQSEPGPTRNSYSLAGRTDVTGGVCPSGSACLFYPASGASESFRRFRVRHPGRLSHRAQHR